MALGLPQGGAGGDYADIVKFDARAGRMFRIDRSNASGQWETNQVEITNGFQAVMDLENIEIGWALFAANIAPQFSMVKYREAPKGAGGDVTLPACPSKEHKPGFRLMMKLGKASGGDVREFASCAKAVTSAMDALHTAYEAQKAANPGKLPLVALTGSTPIVTTGKGQSSTNYSPTFEIVRWLDRPEELPADGKPAAQAAAAAEAQPAPQQQAAKTPEPVGADEF